MAKHNQPYEQMVANLARANEVRIGFAGLKRELVAGLSFAAALENEYAQGVTVATLLLALPGYGPKRVRKTLAVLSISERRKVRDLTDRQRGLLVATIQPTKGAVMTERFIGRQGDVLVFATTEVPKAAKPVDREDGRIVLAHGEVTGHCHAIDSDHAVFLAADLDEMADRFLRVEEECQIVHDEHDTISLVPGDYVVRRQREYAPEAIRRVAD